MKRSTGQRGWWRGAALLAGVVSCLKGLRRPNLWAATQAMVNYDHGFVKRGLFGATVGGWLHLEHYARFTVVSEVLLVLLLGLLAWLTVRSGAFERLGDGEPVAIFFASYAITYLTHLVGYLDIPLAILTVGLIAIRRMEVRLAAAVPVCVAGVLIHEMFVVVFLPVILFSFWVDGVRREGKERTRVWAAAGLLTVVVAGVTMRLALERPMTATQAEAMREDVARRADFEVREDFFAVMGRSSGENFAMMRGVMQAPFFRHRFLASAAAFAPAILLLLAAVVWSVRGVSWRFRGVTMAAAIGAGLSPVGMNFLGYDFGRWDALVCLELYLVALILAKEREPGEVEFRIVYRWAAVVAIVLGLACGELFAKDILLDGAKANSFGSLAKVRRGVGEL
jgi:hypothetical protein